MAMLEARIEKRFPAGPGSAAFDLRVEFSAGVGVTALFGPSGSGKTLTLEAIAGFARPDAGRITLNGSLLFDSAAGVAVPARRRRCGYLFQKDALFPHMSVRENLEFAAVGLAPPERARRIDEVLERFRIKDLEARRPHEISGGERQRSAIARTLLSRPSLLLMDEPAQGLDVALRREFYCALKQIRGEYSLPVLLVTHNLDEAFALADRMLVYHSGKIIQQGAPREIYERPASSRVALLIGVASVFRGRIVDVDSGAGRTRLEANGMLIDGPCLEARRPGEAVEFCIRPEAVLARPRNGVLSGKQLGVTLERASEGAEQVRLEFRGGLTALVDRELFHRGGAAREWTIEFPPGSVWVFPR